MSECPILEAKEIVSKVNYSTNAKLIVYSAVIGAYDDPPLVNCQQTDEIEFICFSDREVEISEPWKLVVVETEDLKPLVHAKLYKIFPHILFPNAESSIWIDGTIHVMSDIQGLFSEALSNAKMATFSHPSRNCVYKEAKACKRLGKEDSHVIDKQILAYKKSGYKANNGLLHGAVLVRSHNDEQIINTMEDWWMELEEYSMRDQLSCNYVAWKNKLRIKTLDSSMYCNPYVMWTSHKNPVQSKKLSLTLWFWLLFYRAQRLIDHL
jgi:hypothetical protein